MDADSESPRGGEADEPGWEVDPDDESGAAVVAAVGRQLKVWREAAQLSGAPRGRSRAVPSPTRSSSGSLNCAMG